MSRRTRGGPHEIRVRPILVGNLINDGGRAFTYDTPGQRLPRQLQRPEHGYDSDGLRLKKTENGVTPY